MRVSSFILHLKLKKCKPKNPNITLASQKQQNGLRWFQVLQHRSAVCDQVCLLPEADIGERKPERVKVSVVAADNEQDVDGFKDVKDVSSSLKDSSFNKKTFTLTYCESAENHKGMQMIGNIAEKGLSHEELLMARDWFTAKDRETTIIRLNDFGPKDVETEAAFLLIIKNGISAFVDPSELYTEQDALETDSKAYMYGRVVNKKARHNLCFANFRQTADYENKKGTVVHFDDVPKTKVIKDTLASILPANKDMQNLVCEGNYYYNAPTTFIGFHGDKERRIVVAARLGADFPIYFQWYHGTKAVGTLFKYTLSGRHVFYE